MKKTLKLSISIFFSTSSSIWNNFCVYSDDLIKFSIIILYHIPFYLIFLFSDLFKKLRTITIGIIQSVLVSFIIVAIFKASVL